MTRISLILTLILFSSALVFAQGTSVGTATAVSPTGSASSSMDDNSHNHYWKVTTTSDGYLRVQISSSSSLDVDMGIYDADGTTYISGDTQTSTISEAFAFLKPGTYYIFAWRGSGTTGSYTITNSFSTPSRATDAELNDSPATALALNPTGVSTGHLGFYGAGTTDGTDYWKITTTQDGWLRIQLTADSLDLRGGIGSLFDVDMSVYDINGTSYVVGDTRTATFSQAAAFLRPGTYYARVYRAIGRAGSYQIKTDFFPPSRANDVEGNDSYQTAGTATVNGTVTGHLGYYSNGTTDSEDWWKFTVPGDGKVVIQIASDSLDQAGAAFDVDVSMYDVNGSSYVFGDTRPGPFSSFTTYLKGGTYFIRPYRAGGNAAGYSLTVNYTSPPRADDGDGNDDAAHAKTLTYGTASTGHLGYYGNGLTDSQDYWKLVAPSTDSIYIQILSDVELDVDFSVYASDGTSYLVGDTRTSAYSQAGFKATAGATYYVRPYKAGGLPASYSILATRSSIALSVEKDANSLFIPTELTLDQNYPNPFNPSTTIRYGLPENSRVRIAVYTLLGQEIAVLANGEQAASTYTIVWNGKNRQGVDVPSGMYVIRLQAGDKQIVKKAMLIR